MQQDTNMPGRIPLNFRGRADAWRQFAERHAGNPFLELDPLYSLPEKLIKAIIRKARQFFTPDELTFEKDLARLDRDDSNRGQAQAKRRRDLLTRQMQERGMNPRTVAAYFEEEDQRRRAIKSRIEAYAGWLVTNRQFRAERDDLQRDWGRRVEIWGGFPSQRRSCREKQPGSVGPPPAPATRASGRTDKSGCEQIARINAPFEAFYHRWGLERFETWDIPQPVRPEFFVFTTHHRFPLSEAGIHLFIPWHLTRDQAFTLQDLVAHLRRTQDLTHLMDWLIKGQNDRGHRRYRRLFRLYRYHHLALVARYGESLRRKMGAIDRAFSSYLDGRGSRKGAENIKRARLDLSKMLGSQK
jgi:hypothetical protein